MVFRSIGMDAVFQFSKRAYGKCFNVKKNTVDCLPEIEVDSASFAALKSKSNWLPNIYSWGLWQMSTLHQIKNIRIIWL